MRVRTAALLAGVAVVLGACSSGPQDSETQSSAEATEEVSTEPPAPEAVTLPIVIVDSTPLDVYYNLDDEQCYAKSAQAMYGDLPVPQLTVRDGGGTILGLFDLIEVGGSFSPGQCTVILEDIEVERADFYQLELVSPDGESFEMRIADDDVPQDSGALQQLIEWKL